MSSADNLKAEAAAQYAPPLIFILRAANAAKRKQIKISLNVKPL